MELPQLRSAGGAQPLGKSQPTHCHMIRPSQGQQSSGWYTDAWPTTVNVVSSHWALRWFLYTNSWLLWGSDLLKPHSGSGTNRSSSSSLSTVSVSLKCGWSSMSVPKVTQASLRWDLEKHWLTYGESYFISSSSLVLLITLRRKSQLGANMSLTALQHLLILFFFFLIERGSHYVA